MILISLSYFQDTSCLACGNTSCVQFSMVSKSSLFPNDGPKTQKPTSSTHSLKTAAVPGSGNLGNEEHRKKKIKRI